MCIYCGTNKYRKIYENHHGKIPLDDNGRTYEIHHVDGNHDNNSSDNLVALTINEHYDIHHKNGDYYACIAIGKRMNKTKEELSKLATDENLKRVQNGTHPWLGGNEVNKRVKNGTHHLLKRPDGSSIGKETQQRLVDNGTHHWIGDGSFQRGVQKRLVENGTHNFIGSPYAKEMYNNGTHPFLGGYIQRESNKRRLTDGTHHLLGGKYQRNQIKEGKHPSQIFWKCEYCLKEGHGSSNYKRWHGINCKVKK